MAIARVTQTGAAFNAVSGTLSLFLTAGNDVMIAVNIRRTATQEVQSITDDLGNSYAAGITSTTTNVRSELWFGKVSTGGAATITITLTASAKFTAHAAEYSGVEKVANSGGQVGTGTGTGTAMSTTSPVTATWGDWIISAFAVQGTGTITKGANQNQVDTRVTSGGAAATNVRGDMEEEGPTADPQIPVPTTATSSASANWAASAFTLQAERRAQVDWLAVVVDYTPAPPAPPAAAAIVGRPDILRFLASYLNHRGVITGRAASQRSLEGVVTGKALSQARLERVLVSRAARVADSVAGYYGRAVHGQILRKSLRKRAARRHDYE